MMQHANVQQTQSEQKKMGVIIASLIAILAVGSMIAFFTATDNAENKFSLKTAGDAVGVEITEEGWDEADDDGDGVPDAAEDLIPGDTVAKAPYMTNTGNEDNWMIFKVTVPKAEVTVSGADAATVEELFTLVDLNKDNAWTVIESDTTGADANVYVYGYNTKVTGGAETSKLFTSVTLKNFEDAPATLGQSITVDGYAIQGTAAANVTDAWGAYETQEGQQ